MFQKPNTTCCVKHVRYTKVLVSIDNGRHLRMTALPVKQYLVCIDLSPSTSSSNPLPHPPLSEFAKNQEKNRIIYGWWPYTSFLRSDVPKNQHHYSITDRLIIYAYIHTTRRFIRQLIYRPVQAGQQSSILHLVTPPESKLTRKPLLIPGAEKVDR